jgi:hypothetical protein
VLPITANLNYIYKKRFEPLKRGRLKSTIFWHITPCIPLKVNRRFGGPCCHLLSRWFLAQLVLQPLRWRQYDPPKCRLTFNGLHGVISQKVGDNHRCENLKFYRGRLNETWYCAFIKPSALAKSWYQMWHYFSGNHQYFNIPKNKKNSDARCMKNTRSGDRITTLAPLTLSMDANYASGWWSRQILVQPLVVLITM